MSIFQTLVHFLFLGEAMVALFAASSDARQCVFIVSNVLYYVLYAPVLYWTLTSDSAYFKRHSLLLNDDGGFDEYVSVSDGDAPASLDLGDGPPPPTPFVGAAARAGGALPRALADEAEAAERTPLLPGTGDVLPGSPAVRGRADVEEVVHSLQLQLRAAGIRLIHRTDLEIQRLVGSGYNGEVFRGRWRHVDVAVKRIRVPLYPGPDGIVAFLEAAQGLLAEGEMLSQLRHPNVLSLLGVCVAPPAICMVTEFMERGSLFDVLQRLRRLAARTARSTPGHPSPRLRDDAALATPPPHALVAVDGATPAATAVAAAAAAAAAAAGSVSIPGAGSSSARSGTASETGTSGDTGSLFRSTGGASVAGHSTLGVGGAEDAGDDVERGTTPPASPHRPPSLSASAPSSAAAASGRSVRSTPTASMSGGLPHLPNELIIKILRDVARGMHFLHSSTPPILHRDLKSQNLLIDRHWNTKVADLGTCRTFDTSHTMTSVGTPQWMAPEVLRSERYSPSADVYSFGVVVWELLSGEPPFLHHNPLHVVSMVAFGNVRLRPPPEAPWALRDLVEACCAPDPADRPTFATILQRLEAVDPTQLHWGGD